MQLVEIAWKRKVVTGRRLNRLTIRIWRDKVCVSLWYVKEEIGDVSGGQKKKSCRQSKKTTQRSF